ncbi:MAG: DUF4276 family protein [Xanthomonadales bacterium]|nr:DUF4276 family protein [Xanthomonadales bacterium]
MTVLVSIEGGGGRRAEQAALRKAFSELFGKLGIARPLPCAECNGSRNAAERSFRLHRQKLGENALLLVDAEGDIASDTPAWQYLKQHDGWALDASTHDQVFVMVQLMESWFVADRQALAEYFGENFHRNQLPGSERDIESIPKADVERGIAASTKDTRRGRYDKGRHSADLLSRLRPDKIEAASPHAKRFFDRLRQVAGT